MATFLVSGIWHGANFTFIIWGAIHGAIQIIEKALGIQKSDNTPKSVIPIRILITFLIVNAAWIFFRMPSFNDAINVIGKIVMQPGTFDSTIMMGSDILMLLTGLSIMILKDIKDEYFGKIQINRYARWSFYILIFILILNFGILDGGSFIYVSF